RGSGSGVELVDLGRARALEGERELVPGLARPVRPEALDDLLGVEHEPRTARKRRLDMSFAVFREVDAEQAVERDRRREVGRDDPDGVQLGHGKTLARSVANAVVRRTFGGWRYPRHTSEFSSPRCESQGSG